jgi:DNA-binding FrmR family transcriptional regulator
MIGKRSLQKFNYVSKGVDVYLSPEIKEQMQRNILSRLKKIEGQIRGLQGMVGENRDCDQILTQVRAAQSALKSVGRLVLKSYLLKCYNEIGENLPRGSAGENGSDGDCSQQVYRRLTYDAAQIFTGSQEHL